MLDSPPTFLVAALILFVFQRLFTSRKMAKLAPGPTRWPFLGNALQVPQEHMWLTFSQWQKKYGTSRCSQISPTKSTYQSPGDIIHVDLLCGMKHSPRHRASCAGKPETCANRKQTTKSSARPKCSLRSTAATVSHIVADVKTP